MSKKITDENGNQFVEVKPWYKRWWIWVIVAILAIFVIANLSGGSDDSSSSDTKQASTKQTKDADDTGKTTGDTIPVDNQTATVLSKQVYDPNWSDSTWAGTTVKIDKVSVIKIKPLTDHDEDDNVYNGVVKVHYVVSPTRDINFYATQGVLNTDDGQQVDANDYTSDDFDGEINKGATKSGNVIYTLKTLKNVKDIKNLRLKWDANYETDNYEDDNSDHTYDITVNLQ
jgi:type II secretory pathway pseudopilin PulG